MTFPDAPLPLIVEAVFGGVTVDLSDRLMGDAVTITRGKAAGAKQVSTGSCKLILDDSDGALTPLNPTGLYYPHVRRGAEFRVRLPEAPGGGGTGGASASIVAPSLDVVDGPALLACMWLALDTSTTNFDFTLPGGMTGGAEADDGNFSASVTATQTVAAGATGTRTATASPTPDNWMAVSVAVPGDVVVQERLSDAALAADVTLTTAASTRAGWWLLAFQGWDLTGVQPPPPSGDGWMLLGEADGVGWVRAWLKPLHEGGAQSVTFETIGGVDNHAHLLVLSGVRAMVLPTADARRFTGTASAYRPRLIPTTDGTMHAVQQIDLAGPLRRLEKGDPPLASPIRRQCLSAENADDTVAYWPCEDGSDSTRVAAGMPGVQPMRIQGDRNFAADSTSFTGSAPLLRLASNTSLGASIPPHTGTGTVAYRGLYAFPSGGLADGTVILDLWQAVTAVRRWRITYHTGGLLQLWAIGSGGTVIDQSGLIGFAVNGTAAMVGFAVVQEGADAHWHVFTRHVADGAIVQGGLDDVFPGMTVDRSAELYINPFGGLTDVTTGHHLVGTDIDLADDVTDALTGHTGEQAVFRFLRLATTENNVPADYVGSNALESAYLGPQRVDTLPNLLHETAFADGGILGEARGSTDLTIRDRHDMYNQTPAVVIDLATYRTTAGSSGGVLAPVYDVTGLVNAFTAERVGGSTAVAVDEASIAADGLFDDSDEFNVQTDEQLADVAAWEVRRGTVDEYRNPALALDLTANPALIPQWAAADLGDRVQRLNPPAPHPPVTIDQLLDGYTETLGPKRWEVSANTQPGGPWAVAEVYDENAGHGYDPRVGADGDMLLWRAVDDNDTSLLVGSASGDQRWATTVDDDESADDFPMDATVGGEVVTVTDVDSVFEDAFTRTTANGWGTPDASFLGTAYTVEGTASLYSVVGGTTARINTSVTNTLYTAHADMGSSDGEVRVLTSIPVVPTGAPITVRLNGRLTDAANYYEAQLSISTAGVASLQIFRRVGGSGAVLDTGGGSVTLAATHTAGNSWWIALRFVGTAIAAKAWRDGQTEPGWLTTGTDDNVPAGTRIGASTRRESGNTNGAQNIDFDNLSARSPQVLTVTRSTNGVVKSHDVGAAVEVAEPAYVAR